MRRRRKRCSHGLLLLLLPPPPHHPSWALLFLCLTRLLRCWPFSSFAVCRPKRRGRDGGPPPRRSHWHGQG